MDESPRDFASASLMTRSGSPLQIKSEPERFFHLGKLAAEIRPSFRVSFS